MDVSFVRLPSKLAAGGDGVVHAVGQHDAPIHVRNPAAAGNLQLTIDGNVKLAGGGQLVFQKKVHGGAAGADRKGQASCKVAKGGKVFLRPFCLALGEKLPEQ